MAALRLRAKTSSGTITINELKSSDKIGDLIQFMSQKLSVDPNALVIKGGFPPKLIETTEVQSEISNHLKSGDTIIVEIQKVESGIPITSNKSVVETGSITNGSASVKVARKVIPADNSCLFNSFSFTYSHAADEYLFTPGHLRELIAVTVGTNVAKYPPEVLGSDVREYQKFIRNPQSWGGAIEAAILADHFELEVRIVDIQTNRIDNFGFSQNFAECVYLLYDGIHYDALFEPSHRKSVFSTSDQQTEDACKSLAKEFKQMNKFTDLQKFSLRCMICNELLLGQNDAQKHAVRTQHINFREV